METSNSDANNAVLNAQNHRRELGPIESSNSDARHTVMHAHNHR